MSTPVQLEGQKHRSMEMENIFTQIRSTDFEQRVEAAQLKKHDLFNSAGATGHAEAKKKKKKKKKSTVTLQLTQGLIPNR